MDPTPGTTRFAVSIPTTYCETRRGKRLKPLGETKKAKAANIRENGACFPCQVLKLPVPRLLLLPYCTLDQILTSV